MPALTPLLPPARPRGANTAGSRACPWDVPTASPDVTGMVAPGAPSPAPEAALATQQCTSSRACCLTGWWQRAAGLIEMLPPGARRLSDN